MPQRDLTFNRNPDLVAEDNGQNPFESELDGSRSASGLSLNSLLNDERNNREEYGQSYGAYAGDDSQNGTHLNLLLHNTSREEYGLSAGPQNTGNFPSEFERYPSMATSRVVSSASLASQLHNLPPNESSLSPDDSSARSADPLGTNIDFSPFGGYPALSFPLHIDEKEEDDFLHNPDPIADAEYEKNRFMHDMKHMDRRSFYGLLGFIVFFIFAVMIFVVLPVLTYTGITEGYTAESYEVLTSYEYPLSAAIRTSLIDPDTPSSARTKTSITGEEWVLTFSDEFNAEGRTFYDGDDQFFQAVDMNYAATKDLEWYDPDAVTTANGTLVLRMDAYENHDLYYRSGMVQSWNKLCFTQGMIVVSAMLPNYGNVSGLWPGLWTMGNLGRPGYLATAEGVWPYSYDSCDAGITANQSSPYGISYLPGQKLNKCTCAGEDHPNRGTGRGAPEIDILEGAVDTTIKVGVASQSLQVAPMDIWYMPDYNFVEIYNSEVTTMNTYAGGPFQQAVSATSTLNVTWYQYGDHDHDYQNFGFEYLNDDDTGHLTWYVGDNATFSITSYALGPNGNIGFRHLSREPMSIIMNLGISNNWAYIDWPSIQFPSMMHVDYVRVYQPEDDINMTCDPDDYPTADYISDHANAYANENLTSWEDAGYTFPKNSLIYDC
ncbi:beta-glucan synthesis-associated [Metschnikowia bicuspidata var. bicuspidata NRRL YB-4993]|uniref:Beta-glucan synthesis-associated n=1 Tax=Metschnikowia bicuspidata var. bicuspidata NRRL YB-4993 TaxID=869754 RepID=A0A1A0HJS0_9ASCO|nr:beta-glucan synthesis-associated [Metschnikowia bicuspidata var. bicuspidata NRRL YB-4993]OBA24246.1 beta-glucan synthesis-associated [Metschnikowia bicuspidata var. bicuspidata NRRL YB-4993]